MDPRLIFIPLFLQALLTFVVGFRLMHQRVAEMKARRIRPQDLTTRVESAARFRDSLPAADNFQNLFEFPVLFYVLVVVTYVTGLASWLMLALLSLFVAGRTVHSAVHLGRNTVMHRFLAFVASTLVLLAAWVVLAFRLFAWS